MNSIFCIPLLLLLPTIASATWYTCYYLGYGCSNLDAGCTLKMPDSVKKEQEAVGKPLKINIDLKVMDVRDIPDQGGSYGIDIK